MIWLQKILIVLSLMCVSAIGGFFAHIYETTKPKDWYQQQFYDAVEDYPCAFNFMQLGKVKYLAGKTEAAQGDFMRARRLDQKLGKEIQQWLADDNRQKPDNLLWYDDCFKNGPINGFIPKEPIELDIEVNP